MRPAMTQPKAKTSLTDQAYAVLRDHVITGRYAPGQEMSEQDLAEQLSMSKTPVREALARMITEGLVEAFPRRGYRVTSVTVKDMNDLFSVRAMLEGTAGALAALNLDEAALERLDALASASYEPGIDTSTQSFIAANERFHSAISVAANNPRLHHLVVSHLQECGRYFYLGAQSRDVNPETNEDHHRIVEVLRLRDPEKARAVMVEHNENTREGLLQALIARSDSALSF